MPNLVTAAADLWIGRRAQPDAAALAAVSGREPAVVITGASRGIGLALARRFARAGHPVIMIARDKQTIDGAAASVARDFNVKAVPLALDLTAADAPQLIDAAASSAHLYVDTLVNNAGIGLAGTFTSHEPGEIDRLIATNITALTRLTRYVLPSLRARARGGILNVASLGGLVPGPNQAAYYASKAYVISLTEAIRHEVRGEGVRVAVVVPGPVETSFHRAMGAEGALYRFIVPSMQPEQVAASAYRGYRLGRGVIVPGLLETIGYAVLRLAPHALSVPLIGRLLALSSNAEEAKKDHP